MKPSAFTHSLMLASHADILAEIRWIESGHPPRTLHDIKALRQMLASVESVIGDCRRLMH